MLMKRPAELNATKRYSICLVSDDFLPSATGVGAHLQVVAAELVKRGHRVSIITSRRPEQSEFEIWQGVKVYRAFTIKLAGFYQALPSVSFVKNIFKDVQPDIVHFHYLGFLLLRTLKIAKEFGLPTVYTYHMSEEHLTQPFFMRPFRSLIANKIIKICNQIHHVISVSKNLATQLPEKGIQSPIQYISNPVIFSEHTPTKSIKNESSFDIFFAGRLDPEKNIPYLLKAFQMLLKTRPNAILRIAGKGTQRSNLEKITKDLGIEAQVKFLGFLTHDELTEYYENCDVFVLPSIFETQGLVAMEAMWFSKPIIVTNRIVSAKELVLHGKNGYIVDASLPEELTNYLYTLSSDKNLCKAMGHAGRQMAQAYRPEIVMDALEEVYGSVERKTSRVKVVNDNKNNNPQKLSTINGI